MPLASFLYFECAQRGIEVGHSEISTIPYSAATSSMNSHEQESYLQLLQFRKSILLNSILIMIVLVTI